MLCSSKSGCLGTPRVLTPQTSAVRFAHAQSTAELSELEATLEAAHRLSTMLSTQLVWASDRIRTAIVVTSVASPMLGAQRRVAGDAEELAPFHGAGDVSLASVSANEGVPRTLCVLATR
mmetsp:Transcript_8921/g.16814  ORF Transcript_8921/g.16814 Transcript_8921/m.16814 type:complete len:120 (-) Transcript_8921:123-482(-)